MSTTSSAASSTAASLEQPSGPSSAPPSGGSFAKATVAALREAADGAYKPAVAAGRALAQARTALAASSDVVQSMALTIDMLVAAERLHDEAEAATKALRAALTQQMAETGATTIQGQYHTAHLSRRPAFVSIEDENAIPGEFAVLKRTIDKRLIAAVLKDGKEVPGATLIRPNEQMLVLKARKETP